MLVVGWIEVDDFRGPPCQKGCGILKSGLCGFPKGQDGRCDTHGRRNAAQGIAAMPPKPPVAGLEHPRRVHLRGSLVQQRVYQRDFRVIDGLHPCGTFRKRIREGIEGVAALDSLAGTVEVTGILGGVK